MSTELMSKYPELVWLTGDVNATPEGANTQDKEYKRTMLSIKLLSYIIKGDYESFTQCQEPKRLSKEKFKEIKRYTLEILKSKEDVEAMITYLIINDLGKVKNVISMVQEQTGIQSVNHDEILYLGLKNVPGISPSFDRLDDKYKKLILNGLRTKFNMAQFIQSENFPADLTPVVGLDKDSFDYHMLHSLYDIGGAVVNETKKGSTTIDDDLWTKYETAERHLKEMQTESDIVQAYNRYLSDRRSALQLQGNGKDVVSAIRLCNMLRIKDPREAQIILETLRKQEPNVRAILEKELTATGIGEDNAILLYYAPATVVNARKYFEGKNSENPTVEGLNIVLPTFARIYSQVRAEMAKGETVPSVTTVMLSDVAKKALNNPVQLTTSNIELKRVDSDFETIVVPINKIRSGENLTNTSSEDGR